MPRIGFVIFIMVYIHFCFPQEEVTTNFDDPCLLFHQACYDGDLTKAKVIFNNYHLDVNCVLDYLSPVHPLHYAVMNGNREMVLWLLNQGASIDVQDKDGYTPLHLAVTMQKDTILHLLLANGANVNLQDKWGRTPLLLAIEQKKHDYVEMLLQKQANPFYRDNMNLSAYEYCVLFADTLMANILHNNYVPCQFFNQYLNAFHFSKLSSNTLMEKWFLKNCQVSDTTISLSTCFDFFHLASYFGKNNWKKNVLSYIKSHFSSDSLLLFRKNLLLKKDLKVTLSLNEAKFPRGIFFVFHPFLSLGFFSNGRFVFARTGLSFFDYNYLLDVSLHGSLTCWPAWNKITVESQTFYQIKEKRYMVSMSFQKGILLHKFLHHTVHLSPGFELGYTWGYYSSLEKETFRSIYFSPLLRYRYDLDWSYISLSLQYINFHQSSSKVFSLISFAIKLP